LIVLEEYLKDIMEMDSLDYEPYKNIEKKIVTINIPVKFTLKPAYPDSYNPVTTGYHNITFDGANLASGVYIVKAEMISMKDNSRHSFVRKVMLLLKYLGIADSFVKTEFWDCFFFV